MKRNPLAFLVLTSGVALALYSACTISSITFSPSTEGGTPPPPGTDASDSANPFDAAFDSNVTPTDASEASVSDGGRLDEASVEAGCCDCDCDGYRNNAGCTAPCPGGPALQPVSAGIDCDDLSGDIHPEKGYTVGTWPAGSPHMPKYDWNCVKGVEEELRTDFSGCSGSCNQEGLQGDPGCNMSANYYQCTPDINALGIVIGCKSSFTSQTQACK